jgi:hypothetical protein
MGNAAASAGAAGPLRDYGPGWSRRRRRRFWREPPTPPRTLPGPQCLPDYGPDGAADGLSKSTPRQADDTRPFGERADASVRCTGLGVSNTSDEAWAGYLYYCMRRFASARPRARLSPARAEMHADARARSPGHVRCARVGGCDAGGCERGSHEQQRASTHDLQPQP